MYPKALEDLISCFKVLPSVGTKTAERYAFTILDLSEEQVQEFVQSLINTKNNIIKCKRCHNISENELCDICMDEQRNQKMVCVVQSAKDVIAMEKTKEYEGVYHVLDGLISPSKGIMPDDINIQSLVDKTESIDEIIIATSSNIDGETTALYLNKILSNTDTLVTRIAFGLPIGGYLDYADELTLIKAIEGRKVIK